MSDELHDEPGITVDTDVTEVRAQATLPTGEHVAVRGQHRGAKGWMLDVDLPSGLTHAAMGQNATADDAMELAGKLAKVAAEAWRARTIADERATEEARTIVGLTGGKLEGATIRVAGVGDVEVR